VQPSLLGKTISITYSECVFVASVIQHAAHRRFILSSVACLALIYPSPPPKLFHKRHDFRGSGELLNIKCVFWFSLQLLSENFLILSRTEWDIIIKVLRSIFKVPVILVRFYWNLNLLNRFSKDTEISNFMKIRPVGAKFFHADGRTDMMKLIVAFRDLVNAPRNCCTDQRGFV